MRDLAAALAVLCAVILPSPSSAGDAPGLPSPYEVDWLLDIPLTLTAGALGIAPTLAGEIGGPACGAACDPTAVNRLDRGVVGNRSGAADTASTWIPYAGFVVLLATKTLDTMKEKPPDGFYGFAVDLAVFFEVQAVNLALNNAVKYAVRRPRPYAYDRGTPVAKRTATEASLSFWSLHTSQMFAGAAATSYTYMLRHPGHWMVVPTWIVSCGLGATVAYLRVRSGNHFWTDVAAGAAVGTSLGLLIPWLHLRDPAGGEPPRVSVAPYVAGQTAGVVAAW
jgi:membrane-associated phospholipid phosphatase